MNKARLFNLLSLVFDHKFHESWDDDWDWLYANDYIGLDEDEFPFITEIGTKAIEGAVMGADDHD